MTDLAAQTGTVVDPGARLVIAVAVVSIAIWLYIYWPQLAGQVRQWRQQRADLRRVQAHDAARRHH